jgi:hypothetical protein
MNHIRHRLLVRHWLVRRVAAVLTGLAALLLAWTAGSPAAFAMRLPPDGATEVPPPPVHTIVVGGMPGWQIALIAVGAALAAAVVTALLTSRARAARRFYVPA